MRSFVWALCALVALAACVNRKIALKPGTQSFIVEISVPEAQRGTKVEPLPYAATQAPTTFDLTVRAMGYNGRPDTGYNGVVFLDAQPGIVTPDKVNVVNGETTITVQLSQAFGRTRIWAEDCGRRLPAQRPDCSDAEFNDFRADCIPRFEAGTLATGVSPALFFEDPSITEVQRTTDGFTSPLVASLADRCSSLADPRYIDISNIPLKDQSFLPRGQVPPKAGNVVKITRGRILVTSIDNTGFYVTDVCPPNGLNDGSCGPQEFNHLFIFNFNFPEGLQVGDRLMELKGTPTEFSGSTQLTNPSWRRDRQGPFKDELPAPIHITPDFYNANIKAGGSTATTMGLENIEGALVCIDGLHMPTYFQLCDRNRDGFVSRSGQFCKLADPDIDLSQFSCFDLRANNPDLIDSSVPCSTNPFEGSTFVRDNADEYCCEANCYNDPDCTEKSAFDAFTQFASALPPLTEGGKQNKVSIVTVNALPSYEPVSFVKKWIEDHAAEEAPPPPPTLRVIGNLVNVTGGRPVWLLKPRGPDDIGFGDTCDNPVSPTRSRSKKR